jgi:hypothetical protein
MLEHLLIKPDNTPLFGEPANNHWHFVILDEAHTYGGSKGSEVSMLLRRLKTTLGKDDIRFILTSATLGDEGQNAEVAEFASKLCSAVFSPEDVIRAKYIPMVKPKSPVALGSVFYADVAKIVSERDVESNLRNYLKGIGKDVEDPRALLYDLVYNDPIVHKMASSLNGVPKTIDVLSEEIGITKQEIVDIITCISATRKLGNRVFNAKYHLFIKGLDGAYITLKGSERFFIRPQKEHMEGDTKFKVFQISTCYNCNAIYLLGNDKSSRFIQVSKNSDEYRGYVPYLLVNNHNVDSEYLEEFKDSVYTLCSECGSIHRGTLQECSCRSKNVNLVIKVQEDGKEQEKLTKCPVCGVQNSRRGLLRQLYLGHDASTSVIASELYKDLLDAQDHRFLTFSDSRQSAAFFAPYMEDTYNGILMKRVIYETMIRNKDRLSGKVSFNDFVSMVKRTSDIYNVLSGADALEAVVRECAQNNSYRSLEFQGFLRYEYSRNQQGAPFIPRDNQQFGLTADEVYNLVNTVIKFIRDKRAVTIDTTDFRPYRFRRGVFVDDGGKDAIRLLNKQVSDYLLNILGSEDKVRKFAELVVNNMLTTEGNAKGKFLDLSCLDITVPTQLYRCSKCRTNYPFNVRNVCIRCNASTLIPVQVNAVERDYDGKHLEFNLDMSKHYIRTCIESPLKRLVIREHTAQLGLDTARNYQMEFKNKKIDVLSCSTTFEMGVDIGTLNSVFMRNVPPSPSNYVQRAGRAGRGEDSSAFTVTFCKEASHDLTYFENPLDMICGSVRVPMIKTDNVSIVLRHIFATALNFFWRGSKDGYPKKSNDFIKQYDQLKEYLFSKPIELQDYLYHIVPESIADKEDGINLAEFGWLKYLFEGDEEVIGRLSSAVNEYKEDIDILDQPLKKVQEDANKMRFEELKKLFVSAVQSGAMSQTIQEKDTLNFLSRYNIIPKYGFPVDVVPMEAARGNFNSNLTRDLRLAITEFAPGCEVVVDGKKVVSKYVTPIPHKTWLQYRYCKCIDCGKMTVVINNNLPDDNPEVQKYLSRCSCGSMLSGVQRFIKPDLGFKYLDSKASVVDKPVRMYSSDISFCDPYSLDDGVCIIGKEEIQILQITNGKLVAVNDNHFLICKKCGYSTQMAALGKKKNFKHDNSGGTECSNELLSSLDLGHIFHTDMLVIRFITHPCKNLKEARSILYALIEGFCRAFSIERDEISGCLDNVGGFYSFIIFDNTPGGSGYVTSVTNDDSFRKVLREAYELVKNCKCGGPTGDSSCYNCLRNYHNQRWHDDLVRGKVVDFLESLEVGQ